MGGPPLVAKRDRDFEGGGRDGGGRGALPLRKKPRRGGGVMGAGLGVDDEGEGEVGGKGAGNRGLAGVGKGGAKETTNSEKGGGVEEGEEGGREGGRGGGRAERSKEGVEDDSSEHLWANDFRAQVPRFSLVKGV